MLLQIALLSGIGTIAAQSVASELLGVSMVSNDQFLLPESFQGVWQGTPEYSVFGPFSSPEYMFSIASTTAGQYLFENNIYYDSSFMGYQRFYVDNKKGGYLWYCGNLSFFADEPEITGSQRKNGFRPDVLPLAVSSTENANVTFCLDSESVAVMGRDDLNPFKEGCAGCDCANWTLSYNAFTDSLTSELSMSGSQHLKVQLQRVGTTATVSTEEFPRRLECDFSEGGRDSVPVEEEEQEKRKSERVVGSIAAAVRCPFLQKQQPHALVKKTVPTATVSTAVAAPSPTPVRHSDKPKHLADSDAVYEHCYRINRLTDFRLQWTLESETEENLEPQLRIAVSASTDIFLNATYVAVGFRPMSRYSDNELTAEGTGRHMDFGMEGADIVMGSAAGVSSLYAAVYTGAPVPDSSLKLTNSSSVLSNGRVTLTFTRPLIGGYLFANYNQSASIVSPAADIIYAVGSVSNGASTAHYHGHTRGLRFVDWEQPELNMDGSWKC